MTDCLHSAREDRLDAYSGGFYIHSEAIAGLFDFSKNLYLYWIPLLFFDYLVSVNQRHVWAMVGIS